MMTQTKQCSKCQLNKSLSEFSPSGKTATGLRYDCKKCQAVFAETVRAPTYDMLKKIKLDAGGCQNPDCQSASDHTRLLSHEQNTGLFDHDHIDELLKLHDKETSAAWITHNWEEFMQRVKPNLQVLCTHCHRERSRERIKLGNPVHGKAHGRNTPALTVDYGYNLFNQQKTWLLFEDDQIGIIPDQTRLEDDWYVTRDGDGNLLRYRDALLGETFGYLYDADGEEIT